MAKVNDNNPKKKKKTKVAGKPEVSAAAGKSKKVKSAAPNSKKIKSEKQKADKVKPAKQKVEKVKPKKIKSEKPKKIKSEKHKAPSKLENAKKLREHRSVKRQKWIEDTIPMGQTIVELANYRNSLDRPVRQSPFEKLPKLNLKNFKSGKLFVIAGSIIGALIIFIAIAIAVCSVDTVSIEGNVHYTNEEIYNMVIDDSLIGKNSIYLSLKYKNKDIEDIPFIQTMNVKITSPSSIKIIVYEKAMAGFVEYKGKYFYFDKDGTVIECSDIKTKGIPQVMGLDFSYIVLYDRLPVEREDIFDQILDITQLLYKNEIEIDKIYFDSSYDVTLYFDEARVKLGDFGNIDEKIIKLKAILPELEGKKGVLRLDNYTNSESTITFEVD